jgi:hypothetical protein
MTKQEVNLYTVLKCCLLVVLTHGLTPAFGQLGGRRAFAFLDVPNNARLAALGGVNTSLADRDINFVYANPALAGDTLAGVASASYQFYTADIGQATFAYGHTFKKLGTLVMGVQHLGYGTIKSYDDTGADLGDFRSGETLLTVARTHQVRYFRVGVALKAAFSSIAGYHANALMVDLGGVFVHPRQDLRVGLVVKNLGFILSEYSETSNSTLPLDVRIGATFKPEHMPLRFSITAYNLARTSAIYDDPADNADNARALDKVLRRFNFGAELLLHRNVNLLLGYNYRVHQELRLQNAGGGAGISLGFSARVRSFEFVFSRGGLVAGSAAYTLSLAANIDNMLNRI